jgi:hypothetical protein
LARKSPALLKRNIKRASDSWAAVGGDISMSSIALVAIAYDAVLDKMVGPTWVEKRWMPDTDYYERLADAANGAQMMFSVLSKLWVIEPDQVYLAIEEPFHYGAVQRGIGGWVKQQAEINGAFKGALAKYGYRHIYEINNSQWRKVLHRTDGIEFTVAKRGMGQAEKRDIALGNKFKVKDWAMAAYGLPDLPDLVKAKEGGKIPRPAEGFGAKAKAEQPNDIYDAAACLAYMQDAIERGEVE